MMTAFFQQPTRQLAQALLGAELVHETSEGTMSGYIVETEAYIGPDDRAAHSYGDRRTKRTEVMFGRPGLAYIYLIYGRHICFNIVSGDIEAPEAILIRALKPVNGIAAMYAHRGLTLHTGDSKKKAQNTHHALTNGPGKLSQALGISRAYNGHDLTTSPLYIREKQKEVPTRHILSGPRIGIGYAGEARDYPWRYWVQGHPYVSR